MPKDEEETENSPEEEHEEKRAHKHFKTGDDEYEILPHKEIEELKEELRKLKQFEVTPTKKMQITMTELNSKLDRLLMIFEEASTALHVEEGGLGFKEQIRPVIERLNKILQQNSEIAQGIVAVADMMRETKARPERPETMPPPPATSFGPPTPPGPAPGTPPPLLPRTPPGTPPPERPPTPPPRRRRFRL